MNNKSWSFQGREFRYATDKEYQQALDCIAKAIEAFGYKVTGANAELDCMDVWGFESSGKRRRRCFLEIYCSVPIVSENAVVSVVFSHPNYDTQECIEVLFDVGGTPDYRSLGELVTGIAEIIDPLKSRKTK